MVNAEDEKVLQTFVEGVAKIASSEWRRMRACLAYRSLQAGDYFVREGEQARHIGFVLSGILRKFYQTASGSEYIKDFSAEGCLVTAYSSLLQNKPSQLNIQALEAVKLIVIPYASFASFYEMHPCWQEFGRKIAESIFIEREQREWELLVLPAKERYEFFRQRYSQLEKRIPRYHVASYLGISPVSLSRLSSHKRPRL